MNLYSGRASLVRVKSVAAAIIFVSLAAGALAEGVKLDTESYLIPSADHDITSILRGSRVFRLIRSFFSSTVRPTRQKQPLICRSAAAR